MSMFGDSDDDLDNGLSQTSHLEDLWKRFSTSKNNHWDRTLFSKRCAFVHSSTFTDLLELEDFIDKYQRGGFHQICQFTS